MREDAIVDATHIIASASTKNQAEKCDPEMHQSKQENNWCFGF